MQTVFGHTRSIAGIALVALGILILYENLDQAAARLSHLQRSTPAGALGVLPTLILAASRVLQACAADQQRFLRDFLQPTLMSSWPLLLVIVGTVLSRDAPTNDVEILPKKDCGLVDLTVGRSTLK